MDNPDVYIRAIACVLAAYDETIIYEATHPRTGIQATPKFLDWPPNSGNVKAFCDDLVARDFRSAYYAALPKPNLDDSRLPPPINRPGRCANLHVSETSPGYAAMVERSGKADEKDWCWYRDHPKWGNGIKVPYDWYVPRANGPAAAFHRPAPTDDELRARYQRRDVA